MKTVLIADDSKLMRTKIKDFIEDEYCVIAEAVDGEGAVKHFKDKKPDIVLLDLIMPIVDGINALKRIIKLIQMQT
jgi:two-component system, chemotaxis family, chemotaxis protein CheY